MPDFLVERLLSFRRVGRGSATLTLGSPPERWFLRSWPSRAFRLGLLPLTRIPGHRAFPGLPSLELFGRPRELRVVPLPNSPVILPIPLPNSACPLDWGCWGVAKESLMPQSL